MVFSNLLFVYLFLPLNLLCYALAKDLKTKNTVMLIFSLAFYAFGEPVYVLLLIGMTFADWVLALIIGKARHRGDKRAAKLGLVAVCIVNLALLAIFKYGAFLLGISNSIIGVPETIPQIALPIGISFYTFQLLSYVVDVYRGDVPPQKRFDRLLLYVALFHQCIAGPIVRYADIESELYNRTTNWAEMADGITRFTVGLAKKAVLANTCGQIADSLLGADSAAAGMMTGSLLEQSLATLKAAPALAVWMGMIAFTLQIYLDFSAYSDMAIGMGQMIGLHYKENFDYPYLSRSITEFWRRWHISLGTFFRDYVYIPLGGSRCVPIRNIFNLLVVWLLTGLWHGASWNFVLWGLYYFVFLVLERYFFREKLKKHRVVSHVYTLVIVFFGWVLFRFRSLSLIGTALLGMFGLNGNGFTNFETNTLIANNLIFLPIAILACTPIIRILSKKLKNNASNGVVTAGVYTACRVGFPVILLLLSTMALAGNTYNPFLYFQF